MKALLSVAGLLLIAAGLSLTSTDDANAGGCAAWRRCGPAVLVPAPNLIPLRKLRVRAAPCVVGCGPVAVAAPVPCAAPCGASFYYMRRGSTPIGRSPGSRTATPGPAIAISAGIAGTIRSAAASAASRTDVMASCIETRPSALLSMRKKRLARRKR